MAGIRSLEQPRRKVTFILDREAIEPAERVSQLRGFWEHITAHPLLDTVAAFESLTRGDLARSWFHEMSAGVALLSGATGFFEPRQPAPFFQPHGHVAATSYYDTRKLKTTLERFVDFDRINSGETRFQRRRGQCSDRKFRLFR